MALTKIKIPSPLGVGTSSPKRQIHLHNPSAASTKIQITNSATGSGTDGEGFQIGIGSSGQAGIEQRENQPMEFYTNNSERMKISSEGYITKNNHPVFRIECANINNVNATGDRTISGSDYQSNKLVQNGSHFNVSTGRFTAPVDGYYYLNFSNRIDAFGGSYIYFTILDNGGTVVTRNLTSLNATYQTLHCSAVHYMSANDYVYVRLSVTGDTDVNMDSDGFFSGFLIG